jgi:hypothetical protein
VEKRNVKKLNYQKLSEIQESEQKFGENYLQTIVSINAHVKTLATAPPVNHLK